MAASRPSNEHGFSMIELTVVLMIIAVLLGIAVPTFLGFRGRAEDTAAKQTAVLAVTTARGIGEDPMFSGVNTFTLNGAEPSLTFVNGSAPSTSFTVVSHALPGAGQDIFVAAVLSASGTCHMIRHQAAGSDFAKDEVASCEADNHGSMTFGPSW
jgi:type IV pilus assembly protein PilA